MSQIILNKELVTKVADQLKLEARVNNVIGGAFLITTLLTGSVTGAAIIQEVSMPMPEEIKPLVRATAILGFLATTLCGLCTQLELQEGSTKKTIEKTLRLLITG